MGRCFAASDLRVSTKFKTDRKMLLNRNWVASMAEPINGKALPSIVFGDQTKDNKAFFRTLNQSLYLWLTALMLVFSLMAKQEVVKPTPWRVLPRITNEVLVIVLFKRFSIC